MPEWNIAQEAAVSQDGSDENLADATESYHGDVDSDGGESMNRVCANRDEDSDDLSEDLPSILDILNNTPKAVEYVRLHCSTGSRDTGGPGTDLNKSKGN